MNDVSCDNTSRLHWFVDEDCGDDYWVDDGNRRGETKWRRADMRRVSRRRSMRCIGWPEEERKLGRNAKSVVVSVVMQKHGVKRGNVVRRK